MNPWAKKEDHQLMASIADGDKAAMAEFVSRHINRIKDFALRYVGACGDADDIVQEAFFRVWRKAPQWQDKKLPPVNWLYRITYNLSIDIIRKRKLEVSIDEQTKRIATEEIEIESSDYELPENNLSNIETKKLLALAFEELPERQRTAIILCHYHGQSNRDAAVIMEVSVEALESLLSRGRRKLKEQLLEKRGTML